MVVSSNTSCRSALRKRDRRRELAKLGKIRYNSDIECIVYNEWVSDWNYHKKHTKRIDFKPNSLNILMFPTKGIGTSKKKKSIKEFGDNTQHIAMREAHSRRIPQ